MINFLLAGVGGQGIILASDILAGVGAAAGYDVKKSEIHGMSQRGGSVDAHVRWGPIVNSPVVPKGQAQYLIAFEIMEGVRNLAYLAAGGTALVSTQRVPPQSVASGETTYPSDEELISAYHTRADQVVQIDALGVARQLEMPAVASTVMLGALSRFLDVGQTVWFEVLKDRIPGDLLEVNRAAFLAGRDAIGPRREGSSRLQRHEVDPEMDCQEERLGDESHSETDRTDLEEGWPAPDNG